MDFGHKTLDDTIRKNKKRYALLNGKPSNTDSVTKVINQRNKSEELCSATKKIIQYEYSLFEENSVFSLMFEYLNFFDFAKLYEVSENFHNLIIKHVEHRYFDKQLCVYFNLEYFLHNIDHKSNTKPKPITMTELKFIFKLYDEYIESITLQTEYLSFEFLRVRQTHYCAIDMFNIIDNFDSLKEIKFIYVDGEKYTRDTYIRRRSLLDNVSACTLIPQDEYSIFDNIFKAGIIFPLVFDYLSYFDFANLCMESKFYEITKIYMKHKYFNERKEKLFKEFNLEHFLLNIDRRANTNVLEKPKPITIKEFKFIFKYFRSNVRSIIVQKEYLIGISANKDSDFLIAEAMNVNKEIPTKIKINNLKIDERKYNTINLNHYPNMDLQHKMITDMPQFLSSTNTQFNEFKMLTDYPGINRNDLITEYVARLNIKSLQLKGACSTLNQYCDDILEALAVESVYLLNEIQIESCLSINLFNLLNKFKYLDTLTLDNISLNMHVNIDLPELQFLRLINCTFIYDLDCYNIVMNSCTKLTSLLIANCDNVSGTFLYEIKRESVNKLHVDLTNLNKDLELEINAEKISDGIEYTCWKYFPYHLQQRNNAIVHCEGMFFDEQIESAVMMPYGFRNILNRYFRSGDNFHLDLRNFTKLNENCLHILKSISFIWKLSINTYYPQIPIKKLEEFLKNLSITEIHVQGYIYAKITDEQNCCARVVNALIFGNATRLKKIEISDCLLGETFPISRFGSELNTEKIFLPCMRRIDFTNCADLNDKICLYLLQKSNKLDELHLSKCNGVTGSFLQSINFFTSVRIYIVNSTATFHYIKDASIVREVDENISLHLRLTKIINSCANDNENYSLSRLGHGACDAIIFDELFFTNLQKFRYIKELTIYTFNPHVNNWSNLSNLNLERLYLINDKFHESDASVDIVSSIVNPLRRCLKKLVLKVCKINEQGIKSINRLPNLWQLSFETVRGLTNQLIKELSVPNRYCTLKIINNDEIDDATCCEIINKLLLGKLSVAYCQKISKNFVKAICLFSKKFISYFPDTLDISGTDAGYDHLWNTQFLPKTYSKLINFSRGANLYYLRRIFDEAQTTSITKLPESLISSFTSQDLLDLRDLPLLDDATFELISQLYDLGTLKIRSNYKNIVDHRTISNTLLKMDVRSLLVQGYDDFSICSNILEPFCYITNSLEKIHLNNCKFTEKFIESLCDFNDFYVLRLSNIEIVLHRKV